MTAFSSLLQKFQQLASPDNLTPPVPALTEPLSLCYRKFFSPEASARSAAHSSMAGALKEEYAVELLQSLPDSDLPNPKVLISRSSVIRCVCMAFVECLCLCV